MKSFPSLLPHIANSFERYLTLERVHSNRTYSYVAMNFWNQPVIDVTRHAPKCKQGESWTYIAVPAGAHLAALDQSERLYVGAQTQDRMFRGDGLDGGNYHHAEMRAGNGDDNPIRYLISGRQVEIHRISADAIRSMVLSTPALACMQPLLVQPKSAKKHVGWWFEQYILFSEPKQWRWNTDPAEKAIARVLGLSA